MDKDFNVIGFINDDDESKDSKEIGQNSEPSSSKAKERIPHILKA